jgi:carboxyl-terminal processing protease
MGRRRGQRCAIFLVLLALLLTIPGAPPLQAATSAQNYEALRLLSEAFYEISHKFVWKKSEEEMIYGALRGLMNSLDPDSSFLTAKEYQELLAGNKVTPSEAGLELVVKENLLTVVSVLEGGPAYRAGMRPGDHILKINGHLVRNLTTQEAARRFQGKSGTTINVQLLRNGVVKPLDLSVTLEPLGTAPVSSKILKDSFAYLRVPFFTDNTPAELAAALKQIKRHRPAVRGLILDLRNNARGTLEQAVRAGGVFLGDQKIVSTRGRSPETEQVYQGKSSQEEHFKHPLPIVVLVDGATARAAEILAAALRDQSQAVLLGTKTLGLCGLTRVFPLKDGSALIMTVAQCYAPHGQKIQGKGLEPNVAGQMPPAGSATPLPLPGKVQPEQDPWIAQAVELLTTGQPPQVAQKEGSK